MHRATESDPRTPKLDRRELDVRGILFRRPCSPAAGTPDALGGEAQESLQRLLDFASLEHP
jgi:hypothetical protein